MTIETIFEQIEGVEFQDDIAIVSGTQLLQLALDHHKLVRMLISQMSLSMESRQKVFDQLVLRLDSGTHKGYRNEYDIAVVAYLYALINVDLFMASSASMRILKHKDLKWAYRLADLVRENILPNRFPNVANKGIVEPHDGDKSLSGFTNLLKETDKLKLVNFPSGLVGGNATKNFVSVIGEPFTYKASNSVTLVQKVA